MLSCCRETGKEERKRTSRKKGKSYHDKDNAAVVVDDSSVFLWNGATEGHPLMVDGRNEFFCVTRDIHTPTIGMTEEEEEEKMTSFLCAWYYPLYY